MKVTIEINCETISELFGHLHVIRKDLKSVVKKMDLKPLDEFPEAIENEDDNCYGDHTVKIQPDEYVVEKD